MEGNSKVLHRYFCRIDTTVVKELGSCSAPKVTAYYLSNTMIPLDGENFFEKCGETTVNSLEDIANSVVSDLFSKDTGRKDIQGMNIFSSEYVNEKVILYCSIDYRVKGKPHISVNRETAVVKGASSDTDELLMLQKLIKDKISKKLQQH